MNGLYLLDNFEFNGFQQLAARPQDVHMPMSYIMELNNLGAVSSPVGGSHTQLDTSTLRIPEIPDMLDISVPLNAADPGKATKLAHIRRKNGVAVYTRQINHI
jgi:hypothetical protein